MKTGYENRSIYNLFMAYQFENDRINKDDAATTKRLIRAELHERINRALAILDTIDGNDENCAHRVHRFYEKQFIRGR